MVTCHGQHCLSASPTVHFVNKPGTSKTAYLRHPTVITTLSSLSSIFVSLSASLHFVKLLGLHSLDFNPSLKGT